MPGGPRDLRKARDRLPPPTPTKDDRQVAHGGQPEQTLKDMVKGPVSVAPGGQPQSNVKDIAKGPGGVAPGGQPQKNKMVHNAYYYDSGTMGREAADSLGGTQGEGARGPTGGAQSGGGVKSSPEPETRAAKQTREQLARSCNGRSITGGRISCARSAVDGGKQQQQQLDDARPVRPVGWNNAVQLMSTQPGPVLADEGRLTDDQFKPVLLYTNDLALSGSAEDMSQGHGIFTGKMVTGHAAPKVSAKDSKKRVKFDPKL